MGYQVGIICYPDKKLAENAYFSQVSPTITADGSLKQIAYNNGSWYYGSTKLTAYLPECSPADNLKAGFEFSALLLPTAVALMISKLIIDLLKT